MASWLSQFVAPLIGTPRVGVARSTVTELLQAPAERILVDFETYALEGYRGNGPVFSVMAVKALAISQVEFKPRVDGEFTGDVPSGLVSPWPGGTLPQLLAQMEVDADLAGNAYVRRVGGYLLRLRPDMVDIVVGVPADPVLSAAGVKVKLGYLFWSEGRHTGKLPDALDVGEVAHYAPLPDPLSSFRGQSWISAVAREVDADTLMSKHKGKFFHNAATPNLVVTANTVTDDQRIRMKEQFTERYEAWENAYKTIYLEGGADIKVVGNNMEQMTFTTTQSAGETRIAAAAGVPPVIVGFLQGIEAATYSNYSQAMRRFADLTCRPRWRSIANSLDVLFPDSEGSLWYDDNGVEFLQQDALDNAVILKERAVTMEILIRSGYDPGTVSKALVTGDFSVLEHTGLVSVQLVEDSSSSDGGSE